MTTLAQEIKDIKAGRTMAQLKAEDKKAYYTVKSLSAKLSEEKAATAGNYITKEDLVEYKGLIIWIMTKKANYRGYLNLKDAMTALLNKVERENIVYKTRRGIKGIVSSLALQVALNNVEDNLRDANGFDVTTNTYGNSILEGFQSFKLNALM